MAMVDVDDSSLQANPKAASVDLV